ncbi:MATE family efflux transporter [Anaerofilum sp. An201]|nr:MATE family efflux transporter [Anaerofilum sp. An201]OUP04485.1 MATE family efflux transporter [Anaerofilum sp. An201]
MESVQAKPLFSTRALCALILPLMVEQLLAVTVGMADTMMVSRVGEAAVSGISLVDSVNVLLIQVFAALATGGAVVVSQYLGRRDRQSACAAARQLIWITALLATVIGAVVLVGNRWILQFVFGRVEPAVMENAMTYFWLSALSYPFIAVYNAGAALFRSMGNSKVSMMTSFIINIINIGGNAILIYGFHWGTAGAGTATLVSRAVAAVVMVVLLHHRNNPVYLEGLLRPYLDRKLAGSILKVGIPNGVENGMFQVGKLLVAGLISSFGTAAIAANAICNNLGSISNIPGAAIGLGMVTVVGQCVGARDHAQARRYTKLLLGWTYAVMTLTNLAVMLLAEPLIGMYHVGAETNRMAFEVMAVYCILCAVVWPLSFTTPNALRAAGDARFTMTVSMFSMWIFRIGFSYILGSWMQMGLFGVWLAMEIDWVVRALFFTIRFLGKKWEKSNVIG